MPAEIYMLNSSSKGNCCFVKNETDLFLIDAGVSARRIRSAVAETGNDYQNIKFILITHEHSDHIKGLETLFHYIQVPIYVPQACVQSVLQSCPSVSPYLHPIKTGDILVFDHTKVYPVRTPHDSDGSCGFRFVFEAEKFAYFTDIGHLSEQVVRAMSGCERVVIESNYDPDMLWQGSYPYPLKERIAGPNGHLSNTDCAALLPHLANHGTRRILLAHLSEENNTPEIAYSTCAEKLPDSVLLRVASPYETVSI